LSTTCLLLEEFVHIKLASHPHHLQPPSFLFIPKPLSPNQHQSLPIQFIMGVCFSANAWKHYQDQEFEFDGNAFNEEETAILYRRFISAAKRTKGVLTLKPSAVLGRASSFRRLFPFFEVHPELEEALFMDFTDTDQITFEQFVKFLSIVTHGTPEEKVELAVRVIDTNNDALIDKQELINFVNAVNKVCKEHDKEHIDTNAQSVASVIFTTHHHNESEEYTAMLQKKSVQIAAAHMGAGTHEHKKERDLLEKPEDLLDADDRKSIASVASGACDTLDYKTFMENAKECPEFSTCFGLGTLIYKHVIVPVLEESECESTYEGILYSPSWNNRWAVVANGFIVFYASEDHEQKNPLEIFALREASVKHVPLKDKDHDKKFMLTIPQRDTNRVFMTDSPEACENWINSIRLNTHPTMPHRFHSFAEVHSDTAAMPFANTKEYYDDLVVNLKAAKHSIMITGWHLTAKLYLTRCGDGKVADRLDEILLERAIAGVKINILVWNEVDIAFKLGSEEASQILNAAHPNIRLMRDPSGLFDFLKLWTHHQKTVVIDGCIGYVGGMDISLGRYDSEEYPVVDEYSKTYIGLDYVNAMSEKGAKYTGDTLTEYQDRKKVPRMPWHDIHLKIVGTAALDIERNFIERWEASRSNDAWIIAPSKKPGKPAIPQTNMHEKCHVQLLRSVGQWSFKFKQAEHSMLTAQLEAIEKSKRFIYIENQFFISASEGQIPNPNNLILQALINRVVKAHEKDEDFRVLIVTPVQASSPIETLVTRTLTYWQYASSYRGVLGFWKILSDKGIDVDKYVFMSSLRNYGRTEEGPILTEMVYVHSKFMIVDDDSVFISSHNINDRSMLGFRDSEIGALVQDTEKVPVVFGEKSKSKVTLNCGKMGHELRKKLFRTFLGLKGDKSEDHLIEDPIAAYDLFVQRCQENSKVYLDVFKRLHDNIYNVGDLRYISHYEDFSKRAHVPTTDEEYEKLQKGVKGFAVNFPRDFLKDSWTYPAVDGSVDAFFV